MFTSTFARDIFFGVVRHFATAGGGWLVAHGIMQANQIDGWAGSVFFLAGLAWSAFEKCERTR